MTSYAERSTKLMLLEPIDWSDWLLIKRVVATSGATDVWLYCDPDAATEIFPDPIPELMTFRSYTNNTAQTYSAMSTEKKASYPYDLEENKRLITAAKELYASLNAVSKEIVTSVAQKNLSYIDGCNTPYSMLRALKTHLKPTTLARKFALENTYEELKKYSSDIPVEHWLDNWEKLHKEAITLKLAFAADFAMERAFIRAIKPIASDYSSSQYFSFTAATELDDIEKVPTLSKLIEKFRNYEREYHPFDEQSTKTSLVTLNGKAPDNAKKEENQGKCPCGTKFKTHDHRKCKVLSPTLRPKEWEELSAKRIEGINRKLRALSEKDRAKYLKTGWEHFTLEEPPSKKKETPSDGGKIILITTACSANTDPLNLLLNEWTLDGGSDAHICNNTVSNNFTKTKDATASDQVRSGKDLHQVESIGTVLLNVETTTGLQTIELRNVHYVPGFMTNLVSLDLVAERNIHWNTRQPEYLQLPNGQGIHLNRVGRHLVLQRLPPLTALAVRNSKTPVKLIQTAKKMHQILGHAGRGAIEHLQKASRDVEIDNAIPVPLTCNCEACALSKATNLISRRTDHELPIDGECTHVSWDLIEMSKNPRGRKYISHMVTTKTGFHLSENLKDKTQATPSLIGQIELLEKQFNCEVKIVRIDGETSLGKEDAEWALYIKRKGIIVEVSAPDTQAQNGKIERAGRAIVQVGRTMRIAAGLPAHLWDEASNTAVYLINRTPTRRLEWKTPFEAVTKSKPQHAHLHPYGCKAYALLKHIPKTQKHDPRAHVGYLVGYESTNSWRIWVPSKSKIFVSRDVIFDDDSFYTPEDLDAGAVLATADFDHIIQQMQRVTFEVDDLSELSDSQTQDENNLPSGLPLTVVTNQSAEIGSHDQTDNTNSLDKPSSTTPRISLPTPSPTETNPPTPPQATPTPPTNSSSLPPNNGHEYWPPGASTTNMAPNRRNPDFDESNIVEGSRTRRGRTALATQIEGGIYNQYLHAFASARTLVRNQRIHRDQLPAVPTNYKQMINSVYSKEWLRALDDEMGSLNEMGMFEEDDLESLELNQKLLLLKLIYTYKFDEEGFLVKFKVRIVARGDLYKTMDETYSATLAAQTLRAMLAIVCAFGFTMKQFDVTNAYANAKLRLRIPSRFPPGLEKEGKFLWVLRALYGLPPAGNLWFNDFTTSLEELGLQAVSGVNCLYMNDWLYILFFVDDILAIFHPRDQYKFEAWEKRLLAKYKIRSLGEASTFLGLRIIRDLQQKKLWLVQDQYIAKLGAKYHIHEPKMPYSTPLPQTSLESYTGTATPSQIHGYQQKVGSVNYPSVWSRPDISKAVSKLAEHLLNPGPKHIEAVDWCIGYLLGTKFLGLEFDGLAYELKGSKIFLTMSDAAFADDILTRYSSYGGAAKLFEGMVMWIAKKQITVTTSTTETELLALSAIAKLYLELLRLFRNINLDLMEDSILYCDNQQTIRLLSNETPRLHTKLKHVDIHQCWLRQEVQAGNIKVEWVETNDMIADGLTKLLPPQKHQAFVRQMNLVNIATRPEFTAK